MEARRKIRILAVASLTFVCASSAGLIYFGTGNGSETTEHSARYVEQTVAVTELNLALDALKNLKSGGDIALKRLHAVSDILDQYPLLKTRAEPSLIGALENVTDPVFRSETFQVLSRMHSSKCLKLLREELLRTDLDFHPILSSLEKYLGSYGDATARDLLWQIARDGKRPERAEATRILAKHMDSRVSALVPQFLRREATPSETLIGLEVVGWLRLKEFRARVSAYTGAESGAIRDQALKALNRLDERSVVERRLPANSTR